MEIFQSLCQKNGYQLDEETETYAVRFFETLFEERTENFGNARDVRNLFESLVAAQADRVSQLESPSVDDLMQVTRKDFQTAAEDENADQEEPQSEEETTEQEE
jgi:hypothetical protein